MTLRPRPSALILACSAALLLAACGGSGTGSTGNAGNEIAGAPGKAAAAPAASSKLAGFMGDNICEVLPVSALQQAFGAPADVNVRKSNSRRTSSCSYSWPRPDAEERKKAMMDQMMKNAMRKPGEKIKLDMRKLATDFNVSIMLQESRTTAANFVPAKLTEEQLQERIKIASDAANKRLTDEQRKLVGKDATESLAGSMIRKTNERTEVDGVGDAAYWIPLMGGSLNVLDGNVQVSVTPMLADDEQANIEAAKRVFGLLQR